MEKVLKLYKYIDGKNDTPFPNVEYQAVVSDFRYDVKRMGGAPIITCTVMHTLCLDKLWSDNVYAYFNGERFFIKQIPTSSYSNTDSRYKHELELVSERFVLDNVYFYDVVDSGENNDRPVSNSSKFSFFGDINEFASRLNQSLQYSNVDYSVVVDDGISSEAKMVSFQDQVFSGAIQEGYNTYNVPFYFEGKVIHFGYTNNAITRTFKYGDKESLLSIQKQNANYKVVNRVTGVGSEDNIPYYYPNDYESKEEVEANGGVWINPQRNLMPSIYRESLGKERFYEALNNTYQIPGSDEYYEFENPYIEGKPKEHIVNFDYIKPTIKGITNSAGLRIDMFKEFAYDANDNDEVDEEGNYLHPYFFAKLRKFDGEHGFNLFDHAIDEQEMVISMTSGSCGACEFVIGVDESTQKNIVQVDNNGDLVRDDKGNVKFGSAQDRQNDTSKYEVWIALRKDIDTFGIIMPNATHKYKPSINDTFVILHIDLPKAYILAAEDKLKEELIKYMSLNNSEKFNFSISFSRIFFAENPNILEQLNENARIQIEYDNTTYELYISSYSYSMSKDVPLPEIRIELSDTLTISQNALQTAISDIRNEIISTIGGGSANVDFLKQGLKYFLRKDKDDRSRGTIATDKGFEAGNLIKGATGAGVYKDANGNWVIETDNLKVRRRFSASDVDIQSIDHIGGQALLTAARMRVDYVLEEPEYYRCYFRKTDGDGNVIHNEWRPSDLAYCNTFNLERQSDGSVGNHYYWRKVVAVSSETNQDTESERTFGDETIRTADYHFVDLSRLEQEYAEGSSAPKSGDKVVHLGYSGDDDAERQSAIVIAGAGTGSPYIRIFQGIHNFTLPSDPEQLKPGDNRLSGRMSIKAGSTGWENLAGLPEEIQKAANAIETIEYGKNNLLLNSGFTGDYVTASLVGSTSLKDKSSLFSPSLKYWDVSGSVVVEESKVSESGYEVSMYDDDVLEQTLYTKVVPNDSYIFSFRGKGGAIRFTFGEVYHQFDMDDESWGTYSHKFQAPEDVTNLRVEAVGDCNICELQLERGNVRSAWGISPLDNRSELAKYDSLTYLQAALKGDTVVSGGLINTNLINMGMYDEESKMTKTTAGINGLYNEDRSIAFWAGGNSEQAAFTEATYLDNPNYIPTQEELNKMAKFVVTHGGRAILNDIILRGYIYALGGKFKGEVEATSGIFKNVKSPNEHFVIDDSGNVKIVGTIETSFDGKRIVLDAETKSVIMYDEIGRETAKMTFVSDVGESWTYGIMDLKRYVGDSDVVQMESRLTPNRLDINDFSDGWEHRSSFSTDGMQSVSKSNNQSESFFGLSRTYEDYLPVGWETIAKADRFCSGRFQGITESIVINANGANHYLDFVGGILVGYNREDKEE